MKAVDLNIYGIKCDSPECGFHDMSVRFEDYPKWLNRPCPICGKSLLTKADLRSVKRLIRIIKIINFIFRNRSFTPSDMTFGKIEMNGTGKMKIKPL